MRMCADGAHELREQDFYHVEDELSFPRCGRREGPNPTPPHASCDFKWKVRARGRSL